MQSNKGLEPAIKFILPIAIGIGGSFFILSLFPYNPLPPLMLAYFFPPMGKESIIPIGIARGISPIAMIISISFIDAVTGLFMVWNYDNIKFIPIIGRKLFSLLKRAEEKGRKLAKEHRWIKSLEFIGIVLFVLIPFQGTGAIGASIIGRIIGMNPWRVWVATLLGSILGCSLIAYGSEIVKILMELNPVFAIGFVVISVLAIYVFLSLLKEKFKRGEE